MAVIETPASQQLTSVMMETLSVVPIAKLSYLNDTEKKGIKKLVFFEKMGANLVKSTYYVG